MKFVIIYAIVLAAALLQTTSAQKHNIQWGVQEPDDRLLHLQIVYEEYQFMTIVSKDVNMKVPGTIHFINVIDRDVKGKGGYATLAKGGIGQNEVTIHFESQKNGRVNFMVEIYGK